MLQWDPWGWGVPGGTLRYGELYGVGALGGPAVALGALCASCWLWGGRAALPRCGIASWEGCGAGRRAARVGLRLGNVP